MGCIINQTCYVVQGRYLGLGEYARENQKVMAHSFWILGQ